jgi:dihydropyrimidinase
MRECKLTIASGTGGAGYFSCFCVAKISANRFVELTSTSPAKIFGLFPKKGSIAPGADADLVVWNPEREVTLSHKTLHQRVDYTPYEGRKVKGAPDVVISRGEVVVESGKSLFRAGRGNLHRPRRLA